MKKSIAELTKEARELHDELQSIISVRDVMVWEEARLWFEINKSGLYKYVFGDEGVDPRQPQASWAAFVKEIGMPKATVEMRIRLYRFWVVEHKIPIKALKQVSSRKLDRAIKYIEEGKQQIVDVLDTAKVLPYDQFMIWLKGNEEPCHHVHTEAAEKVVKICKDCGREIHTAKAK